MKRDDLFSDVSAHGSDFVFDERVAEVFDDMLTRSIPFYSAQQDMVKMIGAKFWLPGTDVYDLGCSTATTLINLCQAIPGPARFLGYDNSQPMLDQAQQKIDGCGLSDRIQVLPADLNDDLASLPVNNASVVTMCWTLQFVRPLQRDRLIRWIFQGLVENGVLVVTDKILANSPHLNRLFIELYYDFKRRNGYSEHEILRKREALENVLVPYRLDENYELFRRNGFEIVETLFQWCNFAGFLCVKKTPPASPGNS